MYDFPLFFLDFIQTLKVNKYNSHWEQSEIQFDIQFTERKSLTLVFSDYIKNLAVECFENKFFKCAALKIDLEFCEHYMQNWRHKFKCRHLAPFSELQSEMEIWILHFITLSSLTLVSITHINSFRYILSNMCPLTWKILFCSFTQMNRCCLGDTPPSVISGNMRWKGCLYVKSLRTSIKGTSYSQTFLYVVTQVRHKPFNICIFSAAKMFSLPWHVKSKPVEWGKTFFHNLYGHMTKVH